MNKFNLISKAGFTLIELMTTVAIVGVLASVALPAYQNYVIKAQVSEAIVIVKPIKNQFIELYSYTGLIPSGSELGLDNSLGGPGWNYSYPGKYVESVHIIAGLIMVKFGNNSHEKLKGNYIYFFPRVNPVKGFQWDCKYNDEQLQAEHVPPICSPMTNGWSVRNGVAISQ